MQNIKHHAANNKTKKQEDSLTINQDRLAISKILFMQQSHFYSLNVYSKQGLALARQINFPKGEVFILINQAIALELQGDIPASMELSFKALQIAESIQDTSGMAFSKSTLGNAYWYLKDYTKAIAFSKMHYNY